MHPNPWKAKSKEAMGCSFIASKSDKIGHRQNTYSALFLVGSHVACHVVRDVKSLMN